MENKLIYDGKNNIMSDFIKTDDILKDMCGIIESSQKAAHQAVNTTLVRRNWLLYTVSIHSIKLILRFSRQCLENLKNYYRGRIMQCCCK